TTQDVREIGRKLGAEAVLEGTIRRDGSKLRISLQLINTQDGFQFWAKSFEREQQGLFRLQDEVAQAVARGVGQGSGLPAPRRMTDNLEAYNLYLKGIYRRNLIWDGALTQSIEYFQRALAEDNRFAAAYAALSFARTLRVWNSQIPPEATLSQATEEW